MELKDSLSESLCSVKLDIFLLSCETTFPAGDEETISADTELSVASIIVESDDATSSTAPSSAALTIPQPKSIIITNNTLKYFNFNNISPFNCENTLI